jgi:YHS domain-containing protein
MSPGAICGIITHMRDDARSAGDKVRMLQAALMGGLAPVPIFVVLVMTTQVAVWKLLLVGLIASIFAAWAAGTFFGLRHVHEAASRAVLGGRHYYFCHQEIRVLFDEYSDVWLRLEDIRHCLGGDGRGVRHYAPEEATLIAGQGRHLYLSEAGVRRYLGTSRHPDRQKFALWFERDFLKPLKARRERNLPLYSTGTGGP